MIDPYRIQLIIFIFVMNCLSLFDLQWKTVKAEHGGHDLFTSLAQLEVLWQNDIKVVAQMEESIRKMEKTIKTFKSYVKHHKIHQLNQTPNYDYLGHPVNAYHFIRHVASGWATVLDEVMENNDTISLIQDLEMLKNRTQEEKLPDKLDVEGGAHGLVRLYSQYTYNVTELVENGKIVTTLDNGQKVESEPSVLKLNSFDLERIAYQGINHQLYDAAVEFLEKLVEKSDEEKKLGIKTIDHLFNHKVDSQKYKTHLSTTKKVHDDRLDKRGQFSRNRRCNQYPFDPELRKKKKFKKGYNATLIDTRSKAKSYMGLKGQSEKMDEYEINTQIQVDKLCRGGQMRTPLERANLRCFYSNSDSEWLRLGPMKIQINSHDPAHAVIRDFFYERECDETTKFLGPHLNFPPGRMNPRSKVNDWTMKNAWPIETSNINFEKMNRRIEHITRLKSDASKNYSEPFMCGNYGIGGHYWTHPDYYSKERVKEMGTKGNRVATILTVLEAPKAGGATVWPFAGISVFPEKGSAIFWHNTLTDSEPDPFTQHTACAVLLGNKWIGNKWVGYNAQWNQKNCALSHEEGFKSIRSYLQ